MSHVALCDFLVFLRWWLRNAMEESMKVSLFAREVATDLAGLFNLPYGTCSPAKLINKWRNEFLSVEKSKFHSRRRQIIKIYVDFSLHIYWTVNDAHLRSFIISADGIALHRKSQRRKITKFHRHRRFSRSFSHIFFCVSEMSSGEWCALCKQWHSLCRGAKKVYQMQNSSLKSQTETKQRKLY